MDAPLHAQQGDTIDRLIWREAGLGAAALGTVLAANPGLAALGPVLPAGTPVILPEITAPALPTRDIVQLWD